MRPRSRSFANAQTNVHIPVHAFAEGICIAVPVYFATGSKWKGILWAAVAGITEPIGALIGYAIYQSGHMNDIAMGIILGAVGADDHAACAPACPTHGCPWSPRASARMPKAGRAPIDWLRHPMPSH